MDSREPSVVSDYDSSSFYDDDGIVSVGSTSFSDHQAVVLPPGENSSTSLSLSQSKRSGKYSVMVGARGLEISGTQEEFIPYSQSRFPEVAEIKFISPQNYIRCVIETQKLSPDTIYGSHLVLKLETPTSSTNNNDESDELFLNDLHKELHSLSLLFESTYASISLYEHESADHGVAQRQGVGEVAVKTGNLKVTDRGNNGWKEVEIGNIYVEGKKRGEVQAELLLDPQKIHLKGHVIVEGIEFRPTYQRSQLSSRNFRLIKARKENEIEKRRRITVLMVDVINSDTEKKNVMKAVSAFAGVEYVYMSKTKMHRLTIVGDVDPVQLGASGEQTQKIMEHGNEVC